MVEIEGETLANCKCPKCGYKYKTNIRYKDEIDLSDYIVDWYADRD